MNLGRSRQTKRLKGINAVIYLALMVIVAAIGIGTLVWQQRRQHAHADSVQGFSQALKAISPEATPGPFRNGNRAARRPASRDRAPGRRVPLDARQRAAARRRLEERRRIEARRRAHAARSAGTRYGS